MGEKQTKKDSPLLEQYYQIKSQHPEAILLYRVGDFYETFGEDAVTTSKILGIVLTRKMCGGGAYTPLAGIPCHAVDNYLPKLVRAGYKVAICDQLEDKTSRKLVKRGITELVTPGVSYNDSLLDNKENNFLASVAFGSGSRGEQMCGVAFLDISTGTFKVAEGDLDYLELLLSDFDPKEIIMERSYIEGFRSRFATKACITPFDEWAFNASACRQKLIDRLGTGSLKGFGIEALTLGISAAGAAIHYLEVTYHGEQGHLRTISRIDRDDYVWMDRFTVRNLEIFSPLSGDGGVSLLNILDRCKTPMGARLLREWLALPLQNIEKINGRLNAVSALIGSGDTLGDIQERLSDIGDMERIVSKAASGRILPRELLQLSRGLKKIAEIGKISSQLNIKEAVPPFRNCSGLASGIGRTLLPDAASQLGKGPVIAPGVSAELDHLRGTLAHGKEILLDIQQRERDNTGITSLKVSYNNVFGYFFEVSNRFREMVPKNWIRKQTLVSAERYITEELKRYEETILGAEEKILALEQQHFAELVRMVQEEIPDLQHNASATARLDTLCSFAETALERNYCRPEVDLENRIHIEEGRHPVIETLMPPGEHYVANSLRMECDDNQIMILTGPNMAGKSAFLRQSALIVLMAHVGSFVPATAAKIGLTDKIFTRVGASDNISRGESTFMVEMNETATILNNLTEGQKEAIEAAKSPEELSALAEECGIELTIDQLEGVSGGLEYTPCPKDFYCHNKTLISQPIV